jgi:hypothetical protein
MGRALAVAAAVAIVFGVTCCGSSSNTASTTTSSPSAAALTPLISPTNTGAPASPTIPSSDTPKSSLIDLTLPPGTTAIGGTPVPGIEVWLVPTEAPDTVTTLSAELPVNQAVDGLAPCGEESNPKLESTTWSWSTGPGYLMVHVAPYYPKVGVRAPGSEVTINRGTDDSQPGCSGTPTPVNTPDSARHSPLLGITMPQGSAPEVAIKPDYESWTVPGTIHQVTSIMRGLLPIGSTLGFRRWCRGDPASGEDGPSWYWRTRAGDSVTVDIMQTTQDDVTRVLVTQKVVQTTLTEDGCVAS